jgi:hypothetical protein
LFFPPPPPPPPPSPRPNDSRYQDPASQVKVRREERVRLVSMASEAEK